MDITKAILYHENGNFNLQSDELYSNPEKFKDFISKLFIRNLALFKPTLLSNIKILKEWNTYYMDFPSDIILIINLLFLELLKKEVMICARDQFCLAKYHEIYKYGPREKTGPLFIYPTNHKCKSCNNSVLCQDCNISINHWAKSKDYIYCFSCNTIKK